MPFNKAQFDAGMLQKLGVVASKFMEIMAQKVSQNNLPEAINEHTSADPPQKKGSKYSIDVVIDTREDAAPMAGAFEWGSGLHGEKGATYPIPGMPWLAIPRERWPKFAPPPDVDPVVLSKVDHPGVEAKPYLQPAIESTRAGFVTSIAKLVKLAYLDSTVRVEVISAKK